jgi:hypothetical protein
VWEFWIHNDIFFSEYKILVIHLVFPPDCTIFSYDWGDYFFIGPSYNDVINVRSTIYEHSIFSNI